MSMRGFALMVAIGIAGVSSGSAAIVSVRGAASVFLEELRAGSPAETASDAAEFPETQSFLPLQVVARLVDPNEEAAAVVAAQFADPRTSTGPDPDEFAIDVALNTLSSGVSYRARAQTEETRTVRFSPFEVGGSNGDSVNITGSMSVDGALAIFAGNESVNLTGAEVRLTVTITKLAGETAPETVFQGTLRIAGGANRQVTIAATGQFPTAGILNTDLAGIDPQLSVFRAFVFPNLVIQYPLRVVVGEEFDLHAVVFLEAENIPGETGVAALIGTPLNSLLDVVTITEGQELAAKMDTALKRERANPTGDAAFLPRGTPFLPACGLFGFEMLLAPLGLIVLRRWR